MAQRRHSNGFFVCSTLLVVCFYLCFRLLTFCDRSSSSCCLDYTSRDLVYAAEIDINEFVHSHAFPFPLITQICILPSYTEPEICSYGRNLQTIRKHVHPSLSEARIATQNLRVEVWQKYPGSTPANPAISGRLSVPQSKS